MPRSRLDAGLLPHYPEMDQVPVHLATPRQLKMLGLCCDNLQAVATVTCKGLEMPLFAIASASRELAHQVA
ncbi:hypothetical protein [Deinococcus roseus]|uniref:Uncharacterized protein n=1 Tax=Deinococcus roseus TaxID=392414 RepID=A0ABQ2DAQ2_9DEIO|nr:hypothetical protein [Deinococcus roseus]GGJ51586.1 hypothetical protein GCM10008938_41970 [Deinococcus roseus]